LECIIKKYIINDQVKAKEVRLIGSDGERLGVLSNSQAQEEARTLGLDLLMIAEKAEPPVCKLVNIGQYKYEQQKKEKKSKKTQPSHVTKELKLSIKISGHDYMVRVNRAKTFLAKGYTVKVSILFKGREITRKDLGREVIERFIKDVAECGGPLGEILDSNRIIFIMLSSKALKGEVK